MAPTSLEPEYLGPFQGESNGVRRPSHLVCRSGWAGRVHGTVLPLEARPGPAEAESPQARVTGLWAGVTQQRCLHLLTPGPVTVILSTLSEWRAHGFLFHWLPEGKGGESGQGGEGQSWPANIPLPKQARCLCDEAGRGGNLMSPIRPGRSGRAGWEEDVNPGP